MKLHLPRSTHNWITLIGATIAGIALSMILFLFTISVFWRSGHAYLGLIIYILLPSVMIIGLLLIPFGMWRYNRREKAGKAVTERTWPMVDLNIQQHRHAFLVFTIGTTFLLFASAVGSYEAFHFTESTTFCGEICHKVMSPEFTAYQNSSHARVSCVECHVGEGADWYVRSKLSGLYQVYSVLSNKYPRPIPTPIHNLRPARETCQKCHWPEKFYSRKLRKETYYMQDEENTQWDIEMIMKIGADHSALGLSEGIHWHINPDIKVEYIAEGGDRETLPWVRYTNLKTGEVKVYQDEENPLDEDAFSVEEIRTMDCMDCHTRPSHDFLPPVAFVNRAITSGEISKDLPEIKTVLLELCDQKFSTIDSAKMAIEEQVLSFYEEDYPDIFEEERELLDKAIAAMQLAYSQNIFPEMGVRWDKYPDHIGHLQFNGCFRCHNNTHVTPEGEKISMDCNLCHTITAQGTPGEMEFAQAGGTLEFVHPDGDEDWKDGFCTDCHTGLNP